MDVGHDINRKLAGTTGSLPPPLCTEPVKTYARESKVLIKRVRRGISILKPINNYSDS